MTDKTKQLTIRLPEELHQKFKIKTVQKSEVMGQVLEDFISKYVADTKEPVPVKKKTEPTVGAVILDIIRAAGEKGIDSAEIRKQTGFSSGKVGDYVYRLKKAGKIEKTDNGFVIV